MNVIIDGVSYTEEHAKKLGLIKVKKEPVKPVENVEKKTEVKTEVKTEKKD